MKKWIALLLAVVMVLGMFAGCGSKETETTETPATSETDAAETTEESTEATEEETATEETTGETKYLKVSLGLNDTLSGLKPISKVGYTMLMQWLFESLMNYDVETGEFVPGLAEKVDVSDDGLVYTVTLREGQTFHDGEPITADDVVFTFTTAICGSFLRNAKLNAIEGYTEAKAGETTEVTGIQKVDDLTVTFTLTQPNCLFMEALSNGCFSILPAHCFEGMTPTEIEEDADFWANPIGSGAYYVSETAYPNYIVLTRHENFYDVAGIENVLCTYYADSEASYAAMISGDYDIMIGIEEEAANNILSQNSDITATVTDSTYHRWLWVNTSRNAGEDGTPHPSLQNAKVRQALNMLIDKEAICQLYGSLSVPTNSQLNPNSEKYNDDLPAPERDLEGAVKILEEEGFEFDTPVRLYCNYTDQTTVDFCELLVQNFAEAGITLEYTIDGNWENYLSCTDYDLRYAATSSFNVIEYWNNEAVSNSKTEKDSNYAVEDPEVVAYRTPRYDDLITAYKSTMDPVEQQEILDQLQYNSYEDMCMINLYCLNSMNLYNTAHVTGFPDMASDYTECCDWHFSDWKLVG